MFVIMNRDACGMLFDTRLYITEYVPSVYIGRYPLALHAFYKRRALTM